MKLASPAFVFASAILIGSPIAAFAQTASESRGESQTTPAPTTERLPLPGASNPTKHDGTETNSMSLSAFEQDPKSDTPTTKSFVEEVAISTRAQIADSQIAVRRSTDPQVRTFAQRLIADDTGMLKRLSALAASKKVTVPSKLDTTRQASVDKLEKAASADFDKAYLQQMVNDHESTIGYFNRFADDSKGDEKKSTKDTEVKAFVDKSLPVLKEHAASAKALYGVSTK